MATTSEAMKKLQLSEEKYRLLAENSKDIIINYDFEGQISFFNKAGLEFTGLTKENYKNKLLIDYIPKESHQTLLNNMKERAEGYLGTRLYEIDLINFKSERFTFEVSSSPIINEGKIVSFISTARDIAERKKAEQQLITSHQTYRNILDSISEAVYIQDENGVFIDINKTVETYYGYPRDFFIGKNPEFLSAPGKNDLSKIVIAVNKAFNGEPQTFEFWGLRKDGTIFPKEVNLTQGNYFGKKVVIAVARDLTDRKKNKEELQKLQKQYFQIVEFAVDGIFHGDPLGNFIGVNPRACEMTGYTKEELLKMNMRQLFTIEEEALKPLRYDLLIKGEIVRNERMMLRKDSSSLPVEMNTKMMPDNTYQSFIRDFTERKKLETELIKAKEIIEESEEKYRKMVELSPDAVIIHTDGIIRYVNSASVILFEAEKKDDLIGKKIINLVHSDFQKIVNQRISKVINYDLKAPIIEEKLITLKGNNFYADVAALPININGKSSVQVVARDITERKRAEMLILQISDKVESQNKELKTINEELLKAKNTAEENEKLKSSFLANMSHEIRTPMNGILGFAQLLKRPNISEEQREKYINVINTSGDHLLDLINDIIDISKIDANQLTINKSVFNLNSLLKELFTIYYSQLSTINKTNIQLKTISCLADNNSFILSDETRLRQILNNLLSNAIKFTEKGTIKFGYTIENDNLIFIVQDTGIGISLDKQKIVFERFRQGSESTERLYGGTGLGLPISKACVELLEGNIWLESTPNEETTFYFSIPYIKATNNNKVEKNLEINNSVFEGLTILIVEDDQTNLIYLKEIFEPLKINVLEANNGVDAIEIVKKQIAIDIILMDIQLPEIDGFEVTKQIKVLNPKIPIVAQTAFAFATDKQKSIEAGCDDFITKPIDSNKLFNIIKRLKLGRN